MAGNRPQSEGLVWRGSPGRTDEMDARGKAATWKGCARRKKDPPGVSCDWRASAEKILLFSKLAPVAAVPSAFVEVPTRLWVGKPGKNYAADYRAARDILSAGLAETFEARQRAYLLLKKHGEQTCKRSEPKCEVCPLTGQCAYIQLQAADRHVV